MRRVAWLVSLLALSLGLCSASAGASYGPSSPAAPNPAEALPLAGALSSGGTTWASIDMGRNDGHHDRFWQLFTERRRSDRLALVTPPGVADNGGLIVAPVNGSTGALVGFDPSQDLAFSPLARSTDAGLHWSAATLPAPLLGGPSTLATASKGRVLALVDENGARVLSSSNGASSHWTTLVSAAQLSRSPAGRTCAIGSLEAVAIIGADTPAVGASCRRPDAPGVLVDADAGWHLADIPVPARLAPDVFDVVRLGARFALLLAVDGSHASLVGAFEHAGDRPWAVAAPLRLDSRRDLVATGTGPNGLLFALVREHGRVVAEVLASPNGPWRSLPALPAHTETIAPLASGGFDALAARGRQLRVWHLDAATARWATVQRVRVPIVYGSSS